MRTKLLAICLAILGLVGFIVPAASAHEPAAAPAQALALPSAVRVNAAVVIETGHRRHYAPRYRTVRKVYYRHGKRVVVVHRVRY